MPKTMSPSNLKALLAAEKADALAATSAASPAPFIGLDCRRDRAAAIPTRVKDTSQ